MASVDMEEWRLECYPGGQLAGRAPAGTTSKRAHALHAANSHGDAADDSNSTRAQSASSTASTDDGDDGIVPGAPEVASPSTGRRPCGGDGSGGGSEDRSSGGGGDRSPKSSMDEDDDDGEPSSSSGSDDHSSDVSMATNAAEAGVATEAMGPEVARSSQEKRYSSAAASEAAAVTGGDQGKNRASDDEDDGAGAGAGAGDADAEGDGYEREAPSTNFLEKRRSASPLPSSPSPPTLSPIATRAFPAATLTEAPPEIEEADQQRQQAAETTAGAAAAAAAAAAKVNPTRGTPGEGVAGRAARRAGGRGDVGGGGVCGVVSGGPIGSGRDGEASTRPAENVVEVTPVAAADVPTREPPFGMIVLTKLRDDDPRLVRSAEKCGVVVRGGGSGGGGQDGPGPGKGAGNDPADPAGGRPGSGGTVHEAGAMEEESVADKRNGGWVGVEGRDRDGSCAQEADRGGAGSFSSGSKKRPISTLGEDSNGDAAVRLAGADGGDREGRMAGRGRLAAEAGQDEGGDDGRERRGKRRNVEQQKRRQQEEPTVKPVVEERDQVRGKQETWTSEVVCCVRRTMRLWPPPRRQRFALRVPTVFSLTFSLSRHIVCRVAAVGCMYVRIYVLCATAVLTLQSVTVKLANVPHMCAFSDGDGCGDGGRGSRGSRQRAYWNH